MHRLWARIIGRNLLKLLPESKKSKIASRYEKQNGLTPKTCWKVIEKPKKLLKGAAQIIIPNIPNFTNSP